MKKNLGYSKFLTYIGRTLSLPDMCTTFSCRPFYILQSSKVQKYILCSAIHIKKFHTIYFKIHGNEALFYRYIHHIFLKILVLAIMKSKIFSKSSNNTNKGMLTNGLFVHELTFFTLGELIEE
jgi:hypothetical protein